MFKDISPDDRSIKEFKTYKQFTFTNSDSGSGVFGLQGVSGSHHNFNTGSAASQSFGTFNEASQSLGHPWDTWYSNGTFFKLPLYYQIRNSYYRYDTTPNPRSDITRYPIYAGSNWSRKWPHGREDSAWGTIHPRTLGNKVNVITVPQKFFGEEIKPYSLKLLDDYGATTLDIRDDGHGQLYDYQYSASFAGGPQDENLVLYLPGITSPGNSPGDMSTFVSQSLNTIIGCPLQQNGAGLVTDVTTNIVRVYGIDNTSSTAFRVTGHEGVTNAVTHNLPASESTFRNGKAISLSMWFKIFSLKTVTAGSGNGETRGIFIGTWFSHTNGSIGLDAQGNTNGGYGYNGWLQFEETGVGTGLFDIAGQSQVGRSTIAFSLGASAGVWHHIVFTQGTDNTVHVYLDGVSKGNINFIEPLQINAFGDGYVDYSGGGGAAVWTGDNADAGGNRGTGRAITDFSEIQFYNKELIQSEITDLYQNPFLLSRCVGNVFYEHGIIALTNRNAIYTGSGLGTGADGFSVQFQATKTSTEYEYQCQIDEYQFNGTTNPSVVVGRSGSIFIPTGSKYISNGSLETPEYLDTIDLVLPAASSSYDLSYSPGTAYENFTTHSEFGTYVTNIGLYNPDNELLAIAKLSNPIKNDPELQLRFVVRFDS